MKRLIVVLLVIACFAAPTMAQQSQVAASTSRDRPLPYGQNGIVGRFQVSVADVTPDATGEVGYTASPYARVLNPGEQVFAAQINVTYRVDWPDLSEDESVTLNGGGPQFRTVGTVGNLAYESELACDFLDNGIVKVPELFPGGTVTITKCWIIRAEDAASLVLYIDDYSVGEDVIWLSLKDATLATPAATPNATPAS